MTSRRPLVALSLFLAACDCSPEGGADESIHQAAGPEASFSDPVPSDRRVHADLLAQLHLADVDHHGLFIDFGMPSRMKYTVGHWRTGWTTDEQDGDVTFSNVGDTGRFFFEADEAGALRLRFRMRPVGSHRLTVFINGHEQERVDLAEQSGFRDYDLEVAAEHIEEGENYVLLRFGGTTRVGDHDVSASIASVRVLRPEEAPDVEVFPVTVAEVQGSAALDALRLPAPARVSYYQQIPSGAELVFASSSLAEATSTDVGGEPVPFRVTAQAPGGEEVELWSGEAGAAWENQRISLDAIAGGVARIAFQVDEDRGAVALGSPSIVTPRPEADTDGSAQNVVLLVIDTLRASKLRPWNASSRVETPSLEALANAGTVFENAQSPENWTKPSCASILTGLFPATHGAKTDEARLPDDALLLSEHLQGAGFSTGSFIANGYVSDRFGFDQGWNHYTNYIREEKSTEAENVFREAAEWIEENKDERFFAYIQTIDPHVPYDPPEAFLRDYDARDDYAGPVEPRQTPTLLEEAKRGDRDFDRSDRRRLEALHDGEISYHDRELGRFIERLREMDVFDDTLFVVTSDHGEEFYEHGSYGHGHSVYQELLHVPLAFHLPGLIPEGARVPDTVSTLDIAATILASAGVEDLPRNEGRSLRGFMNGAPPPGPSVAFSDFLDDRRVIRAGRWKLILRGINATLFDLQTDPGEERELDRHDHPVAMRFLRIHLGQFLGASDRAHWLDAEQGAGGALGSEAADMDDQIRDQLRALGYAN